MQQRPRYTAHAAERVRLVEPCVGIVRFDTDGRVEGVQLLVVIPIRGDLVVELVLIVMTDIVEDLSVVYPGCSDEALSSSERLDASRARLRVARGSSVYRFARLRTSARPFHASA